MTKKKYLMCVSLNEGLKDKLKAEAKETERSASAVVRLAVERYFSSKVPSADFSD